MREPEWQDYYQPGLLLRSNGRTCSAGGNVLRRRRHVACDQSAQHRPDNTKRENEYQKDTDTLLDGISEDRFLPEWRFLNCNHFRHASKGRVDDHDRVATGLVETDGFLHETGKTLDIGFIQLLISISRSLHRTAINQNGD